MRRATYLATDPSAAFHAGWYALVFALAKTRLSAVRRASAGGQWGHREQVRELLAPDDRAGEIGGIGAGGQRVPECAVGGLEPAELERARRVVVDGRRQVDVEVRAVADGEVLEPEDVRAGRRLDDRWPCPDRNGNRRCRGTVRRRSGARRTGSRPGVGALGCRPASGDPGPAPVTLVGDAIAVGTGVTGATAGAAAIGPGSTSTVRIQIGDAR